MKKLLFVILLVVVCAVPVAAAEGLSPSYVLYLPSILGKDPCVHPVYDVLLEHEGEQVCYEKVHVERVYTLETFEGLECWFIASVFEMRNPTLWLGAVVVSDTSGPCYELQPGMLIPLEAKVLGPHTIVGRTPGEGVTIPALLLD